MIPNQPSCVIDMSIKPLGLSPLHDIHQGLHAVFAEKDGWKKPIRYGSAKEEANHLKVGIGVTDVSFDFKLMVQGDGIDSFLAKKLPENKILDTNRSAIDGSFSKDWTIYSRLAVDELFVVSDYSRSEQFHKSIPEGIRQGLHVLDMTSGFAGIAVTGPSAISVMNGIAQLDFSEDEFCSASCAQTGIASVYGLVIRSDVGLVPSYRIYVNREYGRYVWESIFSSSAEYDPRPVGIEALEM